MTTVNISFFFLIVIVFGEHSFANAVECPENQNDEVSYLPSLVDCSKYYVCVHSEPVEMNCPEGLWFDSKLNVCNFPMNVTCGGKIFRMIVKMCLMSLIYIKVV